MRWFKKSNKGKSIDKTISPVVKPLLVSDYLSEKSILFIPSGWQREEIISNLVGSLSLPDMALALRAVLEREKMGTTQISPAITIPHARLKGLKNIESAVGICNQDTLSQNQPGLFFLFISPAEDIKNHLLFLSSLSSLFQAEGFVDDLLKSKGPCEVINKIRKIEKGI